VVGAIARSAQERSSQGQDPIMVEILITPDYEIADGRHRREGCITAGFGLKACLPARVVSPDEVPDIIVTSVVERYDLSLSAKIYMLLPMIERAALEGKMVRSESLKKGSAAENRLHRFSGKMGLEKLAADLGCSTDMLTLARKTASLFKQSDERRTKWLNANLSEMEDWEIYQGAGGSDATWQNWRARRLVDMGHSLADPKTAAIIPEDLREVYEAKLFSVEPGESMALGSINKAVGSYLSTAGGGRSDLQTAAENPALHLTLEKKLLSFGKTMWAEKTWTTLSLDHRLDLAVKIADTLAKAPDEVKNAVASQLLKKR
jgi:hypothetical protein